MFRKEGRQGEERKKGEVEGREGRREGAWVLPASQVTVPSQKSPTWTKGTIAVFVVAAFAIVQSS